MLPVLPLLGALPWPAPGRRCSVPDAVLDSCAQEFHGNLWHSRGCSIRVRGDISIALGMCGSDWMSTPMKSKAPTRPLGRDVTSGVAN